MKNTIALALVGLTLQAASVTAQEPQTLPWSLGSQSTAVGSGTIARGPNGAAFDAPPDLSPPIAGVEVKSSMDIRRAGAARPSGADTTLMSVWLYWQAGHLLRQGKNERAASLYALLAPSVPGIGGHLHLDAASAFAAAGLWQAGSDHLSRAKALGSDPQREARIAVRLDIIKGRWSEAMRGFARVAGDKRERDSAVCGLAIVLLRSDIAPAEVALELADKEVRAALRGLPARCANLPEGAAIDENVTALAVALPRSAAQSLRPAPYDQLLRAKRHLQLAENESARDLLIALLEMSLRPELDCEVPFTMARTLKAMKRRSETRPFYEMAMEACTPELAASDPALRVLRTRAHYWTGRRAMKSRDWATARRAFETIVQEVPKVRHADDAIYYLRQIAMTKKSTDQAQVYLNKLVSDYPTGDMTRQALWEPIFTDLKKRDWPRAHKRLLEAVKLPPDPTYYSQGRFSYYLGLTHMETGSADEAKKAWQQCFSANPSAFYGHLCAQSLSRHFTTSKKWFEGHPRPQHALPVLFDLKDETVRGFVLMGDFNRAATRSEDIAEKSPTAHNLWLTAYLHHLAGNFTVSHNIARRKITGWPERYGHPTPETRLLWEIAFPDPYRRLQDHWSIDRGIDPFFVRAITREESGFETRLVSWAGAVGLMQLIQPTARAFNKGTTAEITQESLMKPEVNIPIATRFLRELFNRFGPAPILLACGYNAGPGAPKKWLKERGGWNLGLFAESIPYSEARNYSRRVTGSHGIYQWLYADAPLAPWPVTAEAAKAR